jgi:hypothetical protein
LSQGCPRGFTDARNQRARTPPAPGDIKSERWARSSRNPGRDQIGTPGRDRRNQHVVLRLIKRCGRPVKMASARGVRRRQWLVASRRKMWTAMGTRHPVQQECVAELCISSPAMPIFQCFQGWSPRWLGREGSNLRMAETRRPLRQFDLRSFKLPAVAPLSANSKALLVTFDLVSKCNQMFG